MAIAPDLSSLWNVEADLRKRSAYHEAGHAAYLWYFSPRNLNDLPFTELHLDDKPNGSGVVYGHIFPRPNLGHNLERQAAVLLAGAFGQVNDLQQFKTKAGWLKYLKSLDGSDSLDDICKLNELTDSEATTGELKEAARVLLDEGFEKTEPLIAELAELLLSTKSTITIPSTDSRVIAILTKYLWP